MRQTSFIFYACCALNIFASIGLADTFSFSLVPVDGNVSGPAGSTVGWGYSIVNQSATNWLLTSGLSADSFAFGSPNLLFDFPVLAPGATVSQAFDALNGFGVYELTWAPTAPSDYTNYGLFTLSAEWWSGDPFNGGSFLQNAPDTTQPYFATVSETTSTTPEPSPLVLELPVFGLIFYGSRKVRRRI